MGGGGTLLFIGGGDGQARVLVTGYVCQSSSGREQRAAHRWLLGGSSGGSGRSNPPARHSSHVAVSPFIV